MSRIRHRSLAGWLALTGLVLAAVEAHAQTTRVTGVVSDAVTGEPLPFANITFLDSRVSTNSDLDGRYVLETYYATDSIRVSSLGYLPSTKAVRRDQDQVINVAMHPSTEELGAVVITHTENPAAVIMRRLVANKPVNNREKLEAYQYEAYNKVQFDLNNITEEFEQKRIFKDFAFIFDNVDTTGGKRFLPVFMTETLSDVYYRQQPKSRLEVIKGTKVSGLESPGITQFLGDMYQNVNIYDNFLVVFGKNFVSPIADGGHNYYRYYLLDSNWVDGHWCYQLSFQPKRVQELAFTGTMWVNDTSYAVKHIEATIAEGANLNFVQGFRVEQDYNEVEPEVWMLTRDQLTVDLNMVKEPEKDRKAVVQGFYARRTARYRDFVINQPKPPKFYSGIDRVKVDLDPLSLSDDYWVTHRHEGLTRQEVGIYNMVDTMKTIPRFNTYVDIVTAIFTGYYTIGMVELGPYFKTYSFNPVEGNRFRLGGRTSTKFSERAELNGYGAYGTRDGKFKFGVGGKTFLSKHPRQIVELTYKADVEQLGESVNAFSEDNILSSLFRRTPNTKLTRVEETKLSYQREWITGTWNTLMLRYRTLNPLGDLRYWQPGIDGGPPTKLLGIHTAEIALNTHFGYNEKFVGEGFTRLSLGARFPIMDLHLAMGLPSLAKSEYGYQKAVLQLTQRLQLGAWGWMRLHAEAGRVWGELPYPLLILHSGNETIYQNELAFNTMNYFEFISDRYAQLFAEHHFEGLVFNRIPLLRKLKWREVVAAKMVVGSLDKRKTEGEMLLLDNMYTLDRGPFAEVSAGVENILKVLRVDGIWRLRYNDHPRTKPFALRLKLVLSF